MTERAEMKPRRVGALASVPEEDPRPRRAPPTVQMTLRASEDVLDQFRGLADALRYTHGQMLEQLIGPRIHASAAQVRRFDALAQAERRSPDEVLQRLLDAYGEAKL